MASIGRKAAMLIAGTTSPPKESDNLPKNHAIRPAIPQLKPIMMDETVLAPSGTNSWAIAKGIGLEQPIAIPPRIRSMTNAAPCAYTIVKRNGDERISENISSFFLLILS